MTYDTIKRPDTVGSISISKLVPNGEHFITTYGHLILPNESITITEFIHRIDGQYPSPFVHIETGELHRWLELMRYAEDHVRHFGVLPLEFEYTDGVYDADDVLKILGDEAVDWLTNKAHKVA